MCWSARHGFVVPVFGDSPYLDECLASLRAQTTASPVLLTTSTPSPYIAAIADRHGVELIVNSVREGIASDWNFALAQARWPFVTLAHQDDVYEIAFAEKSMAALDAVQHAVIAFSDHDEISEAGLASGNLVIWMKRLIARLASFKTPIVQGVCQWALLAFGNPIGCSAVTFKVERLGKFRFSEDLSSNLDWDAWWRFHKAGLAFVYIKEKLVSRRYNDLSATFSLLKNGHRAVEDAIMFSQIWPTPIGIILSYLYRLGYRK